jgi:hypothetical protein
LSTLPPNLPDERTAQRLLDLLTQLEKLGVSPVAPGSGLPPEAAELATLRAQNARLLRRQQAARERLEALALRLEQLPNPQEEAAA